MRGERSVGLLFGMAAMASCAHPHPSSSATPPKPKIKLVTLSVESDAFPNIAKAMTNALAHAKVAGVDESATSKVSIEVVQLSIECVDSTSSCYVAAAKSLSANKVLFAQVDLEGKKPKVAITLFDIGTQVPKTTARTFETEADAIAGVDKLVTEATQ